MFMFREQAKFMNKEEPALTALDQLTA